MAELISGKTLAAKLKAEAAAEAAELREKGVHARLAVVIVGENPASRTYVAGKAKDCAECGLLSDVIALPEETTEAALLEKIAALNADKTVHGVLVQLPLPGHIREKRVIDAISPDKDVDGMTAAGLGGLMTVERGGFAPCTAAACMEMLRHYRIPLRGKNVTVVGTGRTVGMPLLLLKSTGVPIAGKDAVVIGRSNIVGKPAALLLTANNATVTLCHSKTRGLKAKCAAADIIVAAIGKAGFVTADMVKEGAVVIDVGINRNAEGKLCGDVDFAPVAEKAAYITPVPGGVGLMTRAMLMKNTAKAARLQSGL